MESSTNDDNESIHSDDSNNSFSAHKEKLESLINMELKHSGVYREIHFKDNLLKVDLENLFNTCQRLESQIKKKSELLDQLYDSFDDDQKEKKAKLERELLSIFQQFAEINTLFCEAFDDYSYDVLNDTYEFFLNETNKVEGNNLEVSGDLSVIEQREEISNSIIKIKSAMVSDMNNAVNMIFETIIKRPEIELEESNTKLIQEIRQIQQTS